MRKINKETLEKAVAIHEMYKFLEIGMRKLPGYSGTQINGNEYYNPDIWDSPMSLEDGEYLGIDGQRIDVKKIPFDYKVLKENDMIRNNIGDVLVYDGEGKYIFLNNNPIRFLGEWFCKWEKQVK